MPHRLAGLKPQDDHAPSGSARARLRARPDAARRQIRVRAARPPSPGLCESNGNSSKADTRVKRFSCGGRDGRRASSSHLFGMRLAASASSWGKPICTALKPRYRRSGCRGIAAPGAHVQTGRVCSQPSSAIMDFSDATLSIQFSLLLMTHSPEHALSVLAVPAFADNYLWLIHDGRHAAVVDPGDAMAILDALQAHQLTLSAHFTHAPPRRPHGWRT